MRSRGRLQLKQGLAHRFVILGRILGVVRIENVRPASVTGDLASLSDVVEQDLQ